MTAGRNKNSRSRVRKYQRQRAKEKKAEHWQQLLLKRRAKRAEQRRYREQTEV